jgi:hypothetical protein
MTKRSPALVFFATALTGIYGIWWLIKTRSEMVERGAKIASAWYLLIPLLNLILLWEFAQGVEKVTGKKMGAVLGFLLMLFVGPIGMAVVQGKLNEVAAAD